MHVIYGHVNITRDSKNGKRAKGMDTTNRLTLLKSKLALCRAPARSCLSCPGLGGFFAKLASQSFRPPSPPAASLTTDRSQTDPLPRPLPLILHLYYLIAKIYSKQMGGVI